MNNFLDQKHTISLFELSCFVESGTGARTHKNRYSHGFAISCNKTEQCKFVFSDGKVLYLSPNSVIYLPKNSNYTIHQHLGGIFAINFQLDNDVEYSPFVATPKHFDIIMNSFKKTYALWKNKSAMNYHKCLSELYSIIYELQCERQTKYIPTSKQKILQPAIDYINNNYLTDKIEITQLSKLCNISYEYFRRLFFECFSQTPVNYINSLKLIRAKELLSTKLYTVSEVAFQSGFNDISHFSRFFKQNIGISPSDYLNQHIK